MRIALLAVLAFTSCGASGWSWQRYTVFRDFGSFQGIDALGAPLASTIAGELRFDDATYSWQRVELPGAGARLRVALSGREFASTYGIYRKERGAADWQLLEGSRQLDLEFVAEDKSGNVYAQTNFFAIPPGGQKAWSVRVAGTETWQPLALDLSAEVTSDFRGNVYALTRAGSSQPNKLLRLEGAQTTELTQPAAITFDFKGDRFLVTPAGSMRVDDGMGGVKTVLNPFRIQRVSPSGELEPWLEAPGGPALTPLGFGRDGRWYGVVSDNPALLPEDAAYAVGDVVSIGKSELTWRLAASAVENGDGTLGGPVLLSSYSGGFVSDGSLIWAACESGCAGTGNAFSYGLWRLRLGGQP
jgi:hypothetical protein